MKPALWALGISLLALSCMTSPNQIASLRPKQEQVLRVPELDQLIRNIHLDLLQRRADLPWLSGYTTNCLEEGKWIVFIPRRNEGVRFRAQAPDQLVITYISIDTNDGPKYHNDLEGEPACRFPMQKAKLNALILVRGKDNTATATAIRECIIRQCQSLHKDLEN